ncbi:MAG TPA: hypothetical protein VH413_10820 [Verrucomicrobiae bacterium]|jgi:Spy/CpxP family protein refolding chaperone|nr:hypothetical protein [Verrucomicrobiae bacterium]
MNGLTRWRIIAYLAILFIAGVITGAAVMTRTNAATQTLKIGRTEEIQKLMTRRLQALNLTPEQRAKFEPLIKKASEELEATHLQCLERCTVAVDNLHAQIRSQLTPEQNEKLQELEAERHTIMRNKYNYPPDTASAGK